MRIGRLLFCGWTLLAVGATSGVAQDLKRVHDSHSSWLENLKASWHQFCGTVEMHRQRVQVWPEPFAGPDRELARDPFRTMADNGWKLQNTLGHDLFDQETQELTYAGRLQLRGVMTQLPPHRRQVYVLEGPTPADTAKRVAAVHRHISDIAPDQSYSVWTTKIDPPLAAGRHVQRVMERHANGLTTASHVGASSAAAAGAPSGEAGGGASSGTNSAGGSGGTGGQ